jgi:hypothetical protein
MAAGREKGEGPPANRIKNKIKIMKRENYAR